MEAPERDEHEDWSTVLKAVAAYVADSKSHADIPSGATSTYESKNTHETALSEGTLTPGGDGFMLQSSDDILESIRASNQELSRIRLLLKEDFPSMMNEAMLVTESDKVAREYAAAELQVVRDKWKSEVDHLKRIIVLKDEMISNLQMTAFPAASEATEYDAKSLARKLAAAEGEIKRLHELIESQHPSR